MATTDTTNIIAMATAATGGTGSQTIAINVSSTVSAFVLQATPSVGTAPLTTRFYITGAPAIHVDFDAGLALEPREPELQLLNRRAGVDGLYGLRSGIVVVPRATRTNRDYISISRKIIVRHVPNEISGTDGNDACAAAEGPGAVRRRDIVPDR